MTNCLRSRGGLSRWFFAVLLVVLLVLALFVVDVLQEKHAPDVFVGVEVGYNNFDDIVRFVGEVKGYVNLIVIGSLDVTTNATKLETVCDYLYDNGFYFIPFMELTKFVNMTDFFHIAKERWGAHFLGMYISDEPGGKQFDFSQHRVIDQAENYSDAASKYVQTLKEGFQFFSSHFSQPVNVTTFTADYALYWFDYDVGYNAVFTEFGWNFSRQLHIALCRGAARAHSMDWGAILTWTYQQPPYIEDAEALYNDLVLAYNNGAKYTIVFNYPTNVTEFGLLTQEHLNAMKRFWNYVNTFPQPKPTPEVAYVLPEDYGYGFRGPHDQIWGLWNADGHSAQVWNDANNLLESFGTKLDIIYEAQTTSVEHPYEKLIFWNGTTITK